jgi:hypothetical protein
MPRVYLSVFIVDKINLHVNASPLVLLKYFYYNKSMKNQRGRPPKAKTDRKDVDLRIPVTAEQKARIMEAVSLDGGDMASWARPILLRAAESRCQKGAQSR